MDRSSGPVNILIGPNPVTAAIVHTARQFARLDFRSPHKIFQSVIVGLVLYFSLMVLVLLVPFGVTLAGAWSMQRAAALVWSEAEIDAPWHQHIGFAIVAGTYSVFWLVLIAASSPVIAIAAVVTMIERPHIYIRRLLRRLGVLPAAEPAGSTPPLNMRAGAPRKSAGRGKSRRAA